MSYLTERWVEEQQAFLTSLKKDLSDAVAFMQKAGSAIPELTSTLDGIEAKTDALKSELASHLESLRSAGGEAREEIAAEAEVQVERLKERMNRLIGEIDELGDARMLLEMWQKVGNLGQTLDRLQRELREGLARDRRSFKDIRKDLTGLSNRLDAHIRSANEATEVLQTGLGEERKARTAFEGAVAEDRKDWKHSFEELEKSLSSQVDGLNGRLEQSLEAIRRLQNDLENERRAREDLEGSLAREQAERRRLRQIVDEELQAIRFGLTRRIEENEQCCRQVEENTEDKIQALANLLEEESARLAGDQRRVTEELSTVRTCLESFLNWFERSSSWQRLLGRRK